MQDDGDANLNDFKDARSKKLIFFSSNEEYVLVVKTILMLSNTD